MLKAVILFLLGFVCLIKGGDWFVDGATSLAHRFHMPEILIGATVVSIGTTIPEVMVSATGALTGGAGGSAIAYGNAIGSVICNTSLIAAITIAVRPAPIDKGSIKTPLLFFFIAAAFYCAIAYTTGYFSRLSGIILLLMFCVYIALCVRQARAAGRQAVSEMSTGEKSEEAAEEMPVWKTLLLLVAGAAVIAVGANLLVDNGTYIAEALGVPHTVIALTFVALGTSLPELITAITSLIKGHSDLSLGNVIGANLFNLVLVSGLATTLAPFQVPCEKTIAGLNSSLVVDIPVMVGVMLLVSLPAMLKGKLYRWQGVTLLCIYAAFCVYQFAI